MSQRPVVNPDSLPLIRRVPTGNALEWIRIGVMLWRAYPVMWAILALFYAVMMSMLIYLGGVGILFSVLISQVLLGGLMLGCQAVEQKRELEINHLFAGFKAKNSQLVKLGFYYIAAIFLMSLLASGFVAIEPDSLSDLKPGQPLTAEQLQLLAKPLIAMGILFIPVMMAFLYAASLVAINHLHPWQALKLSFVACIKNALPLMFYSFLIGLIYLVISKATLVLGSSGSALVLPVFFFIVFPNMITSLYISYRDIFISANDR